MSDSDAANADDEGGGRDDGARTDSAERNAEPVPVYVTRGLVEVLCEFAGDAEPKPVSISLTATPARDLLPSDRDGGGGRETGSGRGDTALADLDPETPVLSDFFFPGAGESVNAVFGMDLSTPAGGSRARFVSHPKGDTDLSVTDDLAARVLVAVPPWNPENVRAFDRRGNRVPLRVVAAEPPADDREF